MSTPTLKYLCKTEGWRMFLARRKGGAKKRPRVECIFNSDEYEEFTRHIYTAKQPSMLFKTVKYIVFDNISYSVYKHSDKKEFILKPYQSGLRTHKNFTLERIKEKEEDYRYYIEQLQSLKFGLSLLLAKENLIKDVCLYIYTIGAKR